MKHYSSAQWEGLAWAIKAVALGSPPARSGAVHTLDLDSDFFPDLLNLPHNLHLWIFIIFLCTTPQKCPATLHQEFGLFSFHFRCYLLSQSSR